MQMTIDDMVSLIHNYIQVGKAVILTKRNIAINNTKVPC